MKPPAKSPVRYHFHYDLPTSEFPDLRSAAGYELTSARHFISPHRHDSTRLEICCILKGQQTQVINGRDYRMMPGDAVVILPGEGHGTSRFQQEPALIYYVVFALRRAPNGFLNLRQADARRLRHDILHLPRRLFRLSPLGRMMWESMPEVLKKWVHAIGPARPPAVLRVQTHVTALLVEMVACAASSPEIRTSPWSRRVVDYIEAHIADPLTPRGLATHMGLSPDHFKARFKKEIGLPPADYVLRRKIEAAKKLLSARDATVTRVAYDLGFSSSGYFSTVFKRYTGKTPTLFQASES